MKLRNKKTGEIIELLAKPSFVKRNDDYLQSEINTFNSLTELNEEWEDVTEEPKEYWHIAELCAGLQKKQDTDNGEDRFNKEIGNYFETKEEAEKAVEKLKAWKRLGDKGFEFINFPYKKICKYDARTGVGNLEYQVKYYEELEPDLDLLFSGEEG